MLKNSVVTVVILTYKRPHILKRAIHSVLNQTYPHFKICVHDDASGDETGEVVKEMSKKDSRISYYCNPQNLGCVRNSIQSWKQVDTPYFVELCDDNLLLPRFLEEALNGFAKYPEALASVSQSIGINERNEIRRVSLYENCREGLYEPPEGLLFLVKEEPSIFGGALFKSEIRDKVGYFDTEVGALSDWDYTFRIATQFSYSINKTPGTLFWLHENAGSFIRQSQFDWPQWLIMYQKIIKSPYLDTETKKEIDIYFKMRLKRMLIGQGMEAIRCGKYSDAGKSAEVLMDFFKSPRHFFKFKVMIFLCRLFPPYRWYLSLYNKMRAKKKLSEAKIRYDQYQEYASCFEGVNATVSKTL
jgi:glycosyltransferase involved in cell wall biosynthesis